MRSGFRSRCGISMRGNSAPFVDPRLSPSAERSAAATIRSNRKVLPPEFRPAVWREFVLILNVLFFGFFFTMFITLKVLGIKF